ncbi:hypothetical protein [Mucisphaera calidilacus]|uniref:Uncharacterized protein n=1 Tax=Mucisphaera calidilacus TaxID=2527982 RepID=A0A518C0P3_9BACT|nr:hypothetical protein [Mucisphaera calidilacus]QDU72777.1 hypothetical protein Pan265_26510 [Mucisphaera calidilacus]
MGVADDLVEVAGDVGVGPVEELVGDAVEEDQVVEGEAVVEFEEEGSGEGDGRVEFGELDLRAPMIVFEDHAEGSGGVEGEVLFDGDGDDGVGFIPWRVVPDAEGLVGEEDHALDVAVGVDEVGGVGG